MLYGVPKHKRPDPFQVMRESLKAQSEAGAPWREAWNVGRAAAIDAAVGKTQKLAVSDALYAAYAAWRFAYCADSATSPCPVARLETWPSTDFDGLKVGRVVA
jgi:hypothetical protein